MFAVGRGRAVRYCARPGGIVRISQEHRTRGIARVLALILLLNLAVAIAKLMYGWRTRSISIQADGVHSLLDGSSNIIGLVGVWVASRPPDANHPYGHRKYETFAALGVAVMMFMGCWEIGREAWQRFLHPVTPNITNAGFLVLGATIAVNLFVTWYERREGQRLNSEILVADAAHTGSDGAFGGDFEKADLARSLYMAAPAEFAGEGGIEGDHAHGFAVFFTKKHHRAGLFGLFDGQLARFFQGHIFADFFIHDALHPRDFLVGHFLKMLEVETQGIVVEVGAFLLDVGAEYLAQCGVQQVRGRVIAFGEVAFPAIHGAFHGAVHDKFGQMVHDVDHQVVFLFGVEHTDFFVGSK